MTDCSAIPRVLCASALSFCLAGALQYALDSQEAFMNRWLVKSDPDDYSAHDLERDKRTAWTGVSNPLALIHLRTMADGDPVLIYHTGPQRAIVALAAVAGKPRPDPADKSGKRVLIELEFKKWLGKPVELAAIRPDAAFANFDLVRNSRLSVMPVAAAHWKRIESLAAGK